MRYIRKFRRFLAFGCWLAAFMARAQVNVTTFHNDNARDGLNAAESILTPTNVTASLFGRLFLQPVDGYIYAQPLYVSAVQIAGVAHNVVYVATEHDSVYAFDADGNTGANAAPLWHANFINPGAGITTVNSTIDLNCQDISPEVGITGTPVIDPTSNTLYVMANTKENGSFFQRLHALDLATGAEKFGGPVAIQASVPGTGDNSSGGHIAFDPRWGNQRPGLMLLNGLIYIAWASHCDITPFHGWLMAYDAQSLRQVAVWSATPNGSDGGIWQSGAPPSADSSGNVYLGVGNGTFDLNTGGPDAGDSIVKFGPPGGGSLPLLDYFTPSDQATLSANDTDLGSGGVVLLPDQPQGSPHQHLLVEIGKEGSLYLVNRDSMGHFDAGGDRQIVEWLPQIFGGLWGTTAFWNDTLYVGASNDALQAFSFNANNSGLLSATPVSTSSETYYFPGTTPSISANGTTNGIVWTLEGDGTSAVLHAYDATNLANELYNSGADPSQTPGPPVKFAVPTVANGKVYAGTASQLAVYGALWPFGDVPPSNPYFNFINVMYETGITGGCAINPLQYCPDSSTTRGEMAVFIITAMFGGKSFSYTTTPYFSDVPSNNLFFRFIQKMKDLGITSGCGNNNFCPDDPVTRGEMAAFIIAARYGAIPFSYPSTPYFADVPSSNIFFRFVQKMAQMGITSGCGNGNFCPDDSLTRGQMAVFIVTGLLDELLPPNVQLIAGAVPNSGTAGQTVTVILSGVGTNFGAGTQVAVPAGITVSNLQVLSPTSLTVQLTISASATSSLTAANGGPYTIAVTTGTAEADLPNGFFVQ